MARFNLILALLLALSTNHSTAQTSWVWAADHPNGNHAGSTAFTIGDKAYITGGCEHLGALTNEFWEWDRITGTWTQMASMTTGTGRFGPSSFSIGTKGYVTCGKEISYLNDLWEWDQGTNAWSQKTSLPGAAREYAVAFSIGTKGYVATGETPGPNLRDFWEWDQSTDTWTQKPDFPGNARKGAVGFNMDQKGYVGCGYDSIYHNDKDLWMWDPSNSTWTLATTFPGTSRHFAPGFSIGSRAYIGIGMNNTTHGNLTDFWEWEPINDQWTQIATYPGLGRYNCVGFAFDTAGYAGMGQNGSGLLKDIYKLSGVPPYTDWRPIDSLPSTGGRAYASAFTINGKGYVGGGENYSNGTFSDLWELDPATNAWTQKANLLVPTWGGASFTVGNLGYICTGYGSASRRKIFSYDPSSNTWNQKNDFPGMPRYHATGFAIGNNGYITMGIDSTPLQGCLADLWEYDPAADSWTQKSNFPGTPRNSAAGFVIGNNAFITTGRTCTPSFLNDLWMWDQTTDTWTQKQDMPGSVRESSVGFAIAGRGFITTGWHGGAAGFEHDFWRYDPTTDAWRQMGRFAGNERYGAVGFAIGAKAYVGTGEFITTYYSNFWIYNDSLNIATGLQKEDEENFITIYPNPGNGLIHLKSTVRGITVRIFNLEGKFIKEINSGDLLNTEIDLRQNPPGVYLVRIIDAGKIVTRKIITGL